MGIRYLIYCGLAAVLWSCQQTTKETASHLPDISSLALIPQPQKTELRTGWVELGPTMNIQYDECGGEAAKHLLEKLKAAQIGVTRDSKNEPVIRLRCDKPGFHMENPPDEAYSLIINTDSIVLSAKTETGLLRGVQTIIQLVESYSQDELVVLPVVQITDQPSFPHRGMLMDVCRHFFDVETVKAYIDLLAYYKMNTLHWHLTEDQGWRIAIDAYPKLTEIGAWRTEKDGSRYGGFYTKDQIREVVEYAHQRHIRVIPEIELPGHAQAALAAYPELSCTGESIEVANDWGVFKEIYCAGNDSVFVFLRTVLDEVMELFPSEYIHIGGDEAPKYRWEHCKKCQRRIAEEGLHDEHELQSWFIAQIGEYLNENGRTLIGWDEILEGGLAENAVVQSWRGMEGGIRATTSGHAAIMSPTSHCYFDYDLRSTDMEEVHSFNPIPDSLPEDAQSLILGGECNLWSEHIPDRATLDRQTFPRMLAMSEVLWTAPETRNYEEFQNRVARHYPILDGKGVRYGPETYPLSAKTTMRNDSLWLKLEASPKDLHLQVTDSTRGNTFYYESAIRIPNGTRRGFSVQPMRNGKEVGSAITVKARAHKANGLPAIPTQAYHQNYSAGGELGLTDGLLGTTDFRDGRWQGYWGTHFETTIDFGKAQPITHLALRCLQYNNAWIFLPREVRFFGGTDSTALTALGKVNPTALPEQRGQFIESLNLYIDTSEVRFVKVIALNLGRVPDWHEAAGSDAWIFTDELIIE